FDVPWFPYLSIYFDSVRSMNKQYDFAASRTIGEGKHLQFPKLRVSSASPHDVDQMKRVNFVMFGDGTLAKESIVDPQMDQL
ncbi:MAG TPA: hypothetical protein VF141_16730, partial [Chryseolinea sp.]